MPNVLIRELPEDVHAELQRRANAAGQSLQQFLFAELTNLAQTPTLDDVLDRISRHRAGTVGLATAVNDLDEERRG
jgi:antitoxin FitA